MHNKWEVRNLNEKKDVWKNGSFGRNFRNFKTRFWSVAVQSWPPLEIDMSRTGKCALNISPRTRSAKRKKKADDGAEEHRSDGIGTVHHISRALLVWCWTGEVPWTFEAKGLQGMYTDYFLRAFSRLHILTQTLNLISNRYYIFDLLKTYN